MESNGSPIKLIRMNSGKRRIPGRMMTLPLNYDLSKLKDSKLIDIKALKSKATIIKQNNTSSEMPFKTI
jgi:hypothetical protein